MTNGIHIYIIYIYIYIYIYTYIYIYRLLVLGILVQRFYDYYNYSDEKNKEIINNFAKLFCYHVRNSLGKESEFSFLPDDVDSFARPLLQNFQDCIRVFINPRYICIYYMYNKN